MTEGKHIEEIKDEPTVKALRLISLNLGLTAVAYALFYLGPESLVRTQKSERAMAEQVSIVQNIENFGPFWPAVFILAGIGIIWTTLRGRGVIVSHGIAVFAWVVYGVAIIFGGILSQPPSPILTGIAALFGAVTHAGMALAWAGEGVK